MKVGRLKNPERQSMLFDYDRKLETFGAARSWVGDFFEELTAGATGARRVKTDSSADICPDLRIDGRTFIECKGIGLSGQAIMYQGRWKKDQRFIEEDGATIFYFFWRHRFGVAAAASINELRAGLASSVESLFVLDRRSLDQLLRARPVRKINSRYMKSGVRNGYGQEGYGLGWAFPLSEVSALCGLTASFRAVAYGQACSFEARFATLEASTFLRG